MVTRLDLRRTGVTDTGLAQLASLQRLEYLNLYATRVTDAGLPHLAALKRLRSLYTWQTTVTEAGQKQLRTILPHLQRERVATASVEPSQ